VARARGLVERDLLWIRPTDLGMRFLNDLHELFLPGAVAPMPTKVGSALSRRVIPINKAVKS
jgi:hypothetical protein